MKRFLTIALIIFLPLLSHGQDASIQDLSPIERFFQFPDLAIERLIDSALARSNAVQALVLDKNILAEDLKLARKDIFSNLSLVSDYLYGNLGTIAFNEGGPAIGVGTELASRYTGGVRLSLPLDRLTSRHNRINRVEYLIKQADFVQKSREDEIRQLVINMYQEVVLAKRMLDVHTDAKESVNINRQMAERNFREGQIPMTELTEIIQSYTRINIEYQTSYTYYETSLRLLEEVAGVKITELMKP
jgi:outer membrane protein TolC